MSPADRILPADLYMRSSGGECFIRGSNVSSRQYSPEHCENGDHRGSKVSMLQSSLSPAAAIAYNELSFGITTKTRIFKSKCICIMKYRYVITLRTGSVAVWERSDAINIGFVTKLATIEWLSFHLVPPKSKVVAVEKALNVIVKIEHFYCKSIPLRRLADSSKKRW